jgi:hypothetical protein
VDALATGLDVAGEYVGGDEVTVRFAGFETLYVVRRELGEDGIIRWVTTETKVPVGSYEHTLVVFSDNLELQQGVNGSWLLETSKQLGFAGDSIEWFVIVLDAEQALREQGWLAAAEVLVHHGGNWAASGIGATAATGWCASRNMGWASLVCGVVGAVGAGLFAEKTYQLTRRWVL